METPERIFELLGSTADASVLQIRDSDVRVAAGRVAHAIDHDGRRLLLVPIADGENVYEDRGSQGVKLLERNLIDNGDNRRFVTLRCELTSLHDQFGTLCDEVLESLSESPSDPNRTCLTILDRWRQLLGPRSERLLGESALAGLLAELRFLEVLAGIRPDALDLWTGPDGGRFDFMSGGTAVEVKATSGRERFSVGIHGLLQLEPRPAAASICGPSDTNGSRLGINVYLTPSHVLSRWGWGPPTTCMPSSPRLATWLPTAVRTAAYGSPCSTIGRSGSLKRFRGWSGAR